MSKKPQQATPIHALSIDQWCALAKVSRRTFYRLLAAGEGPLVICLSDRRRGIRIDDHERWVQSRAAR
jgi:predicted DNA-binding transcriptional regulator AlpA